MTEPRVTRRPDAASPIYPCASERIDNLRAALASPALPPEIRARREARLAALEDELLEAPPELALLAPALERWRREVLAMAHRARPLELAAAWELTALEFDRVQDVWAANHARHHAAAAIARV